MTKHRTQKICLRLVKSSLICLLCSPFSISPNMVAKAQSADVIRPEQDGDFRSIEIPGNRGSYRQRFWLVVDRDPRGLWCRDLKGRPTIALKYGSVIESVGTSVIARPIQLSQGKAYLQVEIKPVDILYDARLQERGTPSTCFVRASAFFIAPINPDSMGAVHP
ncbi:hypothetical protein [Synechococcus sp. 1G10]|uniref:hypothetical protein n=1 Tax=Synechococcus sp. 1G10 TaxID=2025605 RepID=UPI001E3361E7|nr:hypothetical protein [Synechococcus sp. 1G10]